MAAVPPNRRRSSVVGGEVCTSLLYMPNVFFTKLPTNRSTDDSARPTTELRFRAFLTEGVPCLKAFPANDAANPAQQHLERVFAFSALVGAFCQVFAPFA